MSAQKGTGDATTDTLKGSGANDKTIEVCVVDTLASIDAEEWDACACPEAADGSRPLDPFTTYRFLNSIEVSGALDQCSGWLPRYLIARQNGQVIACMPLFGKLHSQGEYVFDHGWAQAWEGAGGCYYPKLQAAVPFTPVTGRRFLTRPGSGSEGMQALLQGAVNLAQANALSSLHITFCNSDEAEWGKEAGLLHRTGQQFHWHNPGYADFADFLSQLSARKRKNIRRERAQARDFGGRIEILAGADIRHEHWQAMWQFYRNTGARKWGMPYLPQAFFALAYGHLQHDCVLIMARKDGRYVAGALNFIGQNTLFGRYWGCIETHPCLHFEICYYQAIEYAIVNGLARVEAGAQGAHKLARGYLPQETHSLHWIADPGFRSAVAQFLDAERGAVERENTIMTAMGPFRCPAVEERD